MAEARARLTKHPPSEREQRAAAMALARALAVPLGEALALLRAAPALLPRCLSPAEQAQLQQALASLGAGLEPVTAPLPSGRCGAHPTFFADVECRECKTAFCSVCRAAGDGSCGGCRRRARRKRLFFRIRVSLLLAVLAVVLLWAYADVRRRGARTEWKRPVTVAIVVVRLGPVSDAAVKELAAQMRVLEDRLAEESTRLRGPSSARPFALTSFGPVDVQSPPPNGGGSGVWDLVEHTFAKRKYFSTIDAQAELDAGAYDSRIYLIARPPARSGYKSVEGESEEGGRMGFVEVELDEEMADFALFVAAHELMHTLGAGDKYDAVGRARVPDGLADPSRVPLYPQIAAEVMARNVALSPTRERPPETLAELAVGRATAREIGWIGP